MKRNDSARVVQAFALAFAFNLFLPNAAHSNGWEHTSIPLSALAAALNDSDAEIRQKAAFSLGHRHQQKATDHLIQRITTGNIKRIRHKITNSRQHA